MKALRNNFPVILFILFELAVGILLLIDPEAFTKTVLMCFGIVLIVIGAIYLYRVLKDRNEGVSGITMAISLASFLVGALCFTFPSVVMGLFAVVAIIYGVILIVSGIYKAKNYSDAKKAGTHVPAVSLISSILSVALGVVIIVNPFKTVHVLWIFTGISLIFEAALDFVAVLLNFKSDDKGNKKEEQKLLEEKND